MKIGGFDTSKISLKHKIQIWSTFYTIFIVILITFYIKVVDVPKLVLEKEVQKLREGLTASTSTLATAQIRLNELEAKASGMYSAKHSVSEIASLVKNNDLAASLNNISGIIASRSGSILSLQTSLPETRGTFKIVRVRFEFAMGYKDFVLFLKDLNEKEKLTHMRIARYELPETTEKKGQAFIELEIYGAS